MVPLKIFKDGRIHELSADAFGRSIIDLCEKHRKEKRALAFAFVLYDFENPQILKILNDEIYWNALNSISGQYLSIYYIHSREDTLVRTWQVLVTVNKGDYILSRVKTI